MYHNKISISEVKMYSKLFVVALMVLLPLVAAMPYFQEVYEDVPDLLIREKRSPLAEASPGYGHRGFGGGGFRRGYGGFRRGYGGGGFGGGRGGYGGRGGFGGGGFGGGQSSAQSSASSQSFGANIGGLGFSASASQASSSSFGGGFGRK